MPKTVVGFGYNFWPDFYVDALLAQRAAGRPEIKNHCAYLALFVPTLTYINLYKIIECSYNYIII